LHFKWIGSLSVKQVEQITLLVSLHDLEQPIMQTLMCAILSGNRITRMQEGSMAEQAAVENRWRTIGDIWRENQWLYAVIGFMAGLLAFPALEQLVTNTAELLAGFVPEAVGITVTVLFIERLNERREEKRRERELRERLVRDAGSPIRDVAVHAVHNIRKLDLLTGENGILKGSDMFRANLQCSHLGGANLEGTNLLRANLEKARLVEANLAHANLTDANLKNAVLYRANLDKANLSEAKLEGARLGGAELKVARLEYADLTSADLRSANLLGVNLEYANLARAQLEGGLLTAAHLSNANFSGANLQDANLRGANLRETTLESADLRRTDFYGASLNSANLKGAILANADFEESNLFSANFDENTVLPDAAEIGKDNEGKRLFDKYWILNFDMTRYTDSTHPDFWQPEWKRK
jgi:uncharacterized protein YjbI with pentapeptide repeats